MKAIHTAQELINEDSSSLTFFSEREKSITKEASEHKQTIPSEENAAMQKKTRNAKISLHQISYIYGIFSVMEQIRSGEIL